MDFFFIYINSKNMNVDLKKLKLERLERIESKKKIIKSKKERKLMKYSDNFNEIFNFFLKSYRCGILDFCGSIVEVKQDLNSDDGKFSFRLFDNGRFKNGDIFSAHPNILKAVIIAKKSWGLFVKEWSDGISECLFTKDEILNQFKENNITIPDVFMKEFDNKILESKFIFLNKNKKNIII